MVQPKIKFNL